MGFEDEDFNEILVNLESEAISARDSRLGTDLGVIFDSRRFSAGKFSAN